MQIFNTLLAQRLIFGISVALFVLLFVGGVARVLVTEHRFPQISDMYYPHLVQLMEDEDYERAVHQFRVAIGLDLAANPGRLQHGLGMALIQQDKIDEGINELQIALSHDPQAAAVHRSLAEAFLRKGEVEKAMHHGQQAVGLGMDDDQLRASLGQFLRQKGIELLRQGRLDEAENHIQQALDIDANATSFVNRGIIRAARQDYQQALDDFNHAIDLQPGLAEAYNSRGVLYARTGRLDQAAEDFSQAIRLKPDFADAYVNRANAYKQMRKYDQAVADYTVAVSLVPPGVQPELRRRIALIKAEKEKSAP